VRADLVWGEAREAVGHAVAFGKMEPSEAHLVAKEAAAGTSTYQSCQSSSMCSGEIDPSNKAVV